MEYLGEGPSRLGGTDLSFEGGSGKVSGVPLHTSFPDMPLLVFPDEELPPAYSPVTQEPHSQGRHLGANLNLLPHLHNPGHGNASTHRPHLASSLKGLPVCLSSCGTPAACHVNCCACPILPKAVAGCVLFVCSMS